MERIEKCQRCKVESANIKSLWLSPQELFNYMPAIPFTCDGMYPTRDDREEPVPFYTLRLCNVCRVDFCQQFKFWWEVLQ